jgi:hypothetical protein
MRTYLIGSAVATVVGFFFVGCSGDNGSQPPGNEAGAADAALDVQNDIVVPQNCDLNADITASPACVDDGIGVFVDVTSGSDTNTGTKASPFKTIAKGIAAAGAKPRVYVCDGTYPEDLSLNEANALSIYGGLACGSWTYDAGQPIVGTSNLAVHIDSVTKPVVLSDLTFSAANGVNPGDSSVAALVNASTQVTLRRIKFRPGTGQAGSAGVTGSNWTMVAQTDSSIIGNSAMDGTGGTAHACTICMDSVNSTGGGGGSGGAATQSAGGNGAPNLSGMGPTDGKGGTAGCAAGDNGPNAEAATAAPGATEVGKLTSTGWVPSSGGNGANGGPGQGGGGGGGTASLTSPGGGAGGGCGGCGGAAGQTGMGGGASIGLASVMSTVVLASCDILTVAAGNGGSGSVGQVGQLGGYAGKAVSPGCAGGIGGQGGTGGAGGGGAGGISVGIVWTSTQPTTDQTTTIVVPTAPATKGTGGSAGVNDGIDGLAQPTFQASST